MGLPKHVNEVVRTRCRSRDRQAPRGQSPQKLRTGDIDLTDQERAEFATFMGITKWRTKFARDLMNSTALEIMRHGFEKTVRDGKVPDIVAQLEEERGTKFNLPIEKIEAMAASIADGTTELIQSSKAWSIKVAFERAEGFGNILSQVPGDSSKLRRDGRSSLPTTRFTRSIL